MKHALAPIVLLIAAGGAWALQPGATVIPVAAERSITINPGDEPKPFLEFGPWSESASYTGPEAGPITVTECKALQKSQLDKFGALFDLRTSALGRTDAASSLRFVFRVESPTSFRLVLSHDGGPVGAFYRTGRVTFTLTGLGVGVGGKDRPAAFGGKYIDIAGLLRHGPYELHVSAFSAGSGGIIPLDAHSDGDIAILPYPAEANIRGQLVFGPGRCNSADLADVSGLGAPDGQLTAADVVAFFTWFFAQEPCGPVIFDSADGLTPIPCNPADIADLSGAPIPDGILSPGDVVAFLRAFFAGHCDPIPDAPPGTPG